jgi:Replication protein
MSTILRHNSEKSPIFLENIDQALQECNRIGVTDVSTQVQKREIPTALRKSSGGLPSSFSRRCRDTEETPEKLVSAANFPPFSSPELDTLAQLWTGTEYQIDTSLLKRAVAKHKTLEVLFPLIDLKSSLYKSYWKTFHCCNVLLQEDKKITGKYCNNRWCLVCNRIRTAKLINGYLPGIKQDLVDPYFVTLTIPNVPGPDLRRSISEMTRTIRKITNLFRNRRDFKLRGIRKIECTYNSKSKEFHPHLHLLVGGIHVANQLRAEWLIHYPDATFEAQDIRPADQNSLIELFKYSTKLSAKGKDDPKALDTIFKALYQKRIFQPIGMKKLSVSEDIDEIQAQEIESLKSAIEVWEWKHEVSDWVNPSGEGLTGCQEYKKGKDSTGSNRIQLQLETKKIIDQKFFETYRSEILDKRSLKETISAFESDIRIENFVVTARNLNTGIPIYNKKEVLSESFETDSSEILDKRSLKETILAFESDIRIE